MADRGKTIKALEERIIEANPWKDQPPLRCDISYPLLVDVLELLKEQEKLIDVDKLREKLGFANYCEQCKQNTRACQYDSHFSLMDFCERLDMAIEELKREGR